MSERFEIFNEKDLPGTIFQHRSHVMKDLNYSLGDVILIMQRNMARDIAQKIVEKPEVFKVESIPMIEGAASVSCDIVMFTREELRAELLKYFRKGMESARTYFPGTYTVQS